MGNKTSIYLPYIVMIYDFTTSKANKISPSLFYYLYCYY